MKKNFYFILFKFRYTQGSPDEAYEKVRDELNLNTPKKIPTPEIIVRNNNIVRI